VTQTLITGGAPNTVTPVNDPPSAVAQNVATSRTTPLSITLSGTDPENSALAYSIVTPPTHGTVTGGSGANRTYTPEADTPGPTASLSK